MFSVSGVDAGGVRGVSGFGAGFLGWILAGFAGVVAGTVGTVPGQKLNGGSVVA